MPRHIREKLKLKLNKIINRIFLGKIISSIPYSTIKNIKEIIDKNEYKTTLSYVKKIDNCSIEKYNFPLKYPMVFPREKAYDEKIIYKVTNGHLSTRTGVIWTSNEKILLESIGSMGRLLGWGDILVDFLINKTTNSILDENVIVCPNTGYYHWLLEVLPNILHLYKNLNESFKIAISPDAPKYLTSALKQLLKEKYNDTIIILDKPTQIKSIFFTYFEDHSGYIRSIDRNILKEYFLQQYFPNNFHDKVYISRLKAPRRSIGNEKDVENILKIEGFEIIYAEDLTWIEQIALYHSSKFIVAPHGAGLSNIIWCKENTKILEIFPYNHLHFCFATLALANELNYSYIVCDQDSTSSGSVNINTLLKSI